MGKGEGETKGEGEGEVLEFAVDFVPDGSTASKRRLLESLGWGVASVTFLDWANLPNALVGGTAVQERAARKAEEGVGGEGGEEQRGAWRDLMRRKLAEVGVEVPQVEEEEGGGGGGRGS